MNNYIYAGLAIAKVVGITALVALAVVALIFMVYVICLSVQAIIRQLKKNRLERKAELKLEEARQKLIEVGAFMDILKKQSDAQKNANEQK